LNLLNILLNTIKYRFSSLVRRIRLLTSPSNFKSVVLVKVSAFFRSLLDFKPRDKNDYYTVFGWMISKKLAYLIVLGIGLISLIYVTNVKNIYFSTEGDGVKTYSYNNILLRFTDGQVRIKGAGGYTAYEGFVSKGYAEGNGRLYDHDEDLVYAGNFSKSKFEGQGVSYYDDGMTCYSGEFSDNDYNGQGTLMRQSGSTEYTGAFVNGMKDGDGVLYNTSGKAVFSGRFMQDDIAYSDLVGLTAEDLNVAYTGARTIYQGDDTFQVLLEDIDAIYDGSVNSNTLDDSVNIDSVYVLKDYFRINGKKMVTIEELTEFFGEPAYSGTSPVTQTEALAISKVRQQSGEKYYSPVSIDMEYVYDDYYTVTGYDSDELVYLYTYDFAGVRYTFVTEDMGKSFGFYYMTKSNEEDEE